MHRMADIWILLFCLLLALRANACGSTLPDQPTTPEVIVEPTATPTPEPTVEPTVEPEPTAEPEPELPAELTGAWYAIIDGAVRGLYLHEDGTCELTWEDTDTESVSGEWTFADGAVILDDALSVPLIPEDGLLIGTDETGARIEYMREKPEPEPADEPTGEAAYYGEWKLDSIINLSNGFAFPASALNLNIVLRIEETGITALVNGNAVEDVLRSYEFGEDGVLRCTAEYNGKQFEAQLTLREDGTLYGLAESEGLACVFVPAA